MNNTGKSKMTNYRWVICGMLFFATLVNYMDRQVLSLTWEGFIAPEFHWTNKSYGLITGLFSLFYAVSMLFAGRFVDWMDTKKGFLWSIGIWSVGAVLHAFCGIATSGIMTGEWFVGFAGAKETIATVSDVGMIINVSVTLFIFARLVLAIGEAGNFPAAIKTTAEYFPKKDRAYATSIFNAGSTIGALLAPLCIPLLAQYWGWEMAFIIIGALGFVWMGFWIFIYKKPEKHPKVNKPELEYILSDDKEETVTSSKESTSFLQCFKYRQTWAFAFGKFMTDGVWWFYLFWAPAYLSQVYGLKLNSTGDSRGMIALAVLYLIVMLSLYGGKLPGIIIGKTGKNPYAARMQAMLIFAFFPLLVLLAQPLGHISYWIPVVLIGLAGAAHQSWSANIFSTVGDMFPKKAIATITGIGGMAGGIGSLIIQFGAGWLFDFTQKNWSTINGQALLEKYPQFQNQETADALLKEYGVKNIGDFFKALNAAGDTVVDGIRSGYMIIFSVCAVAYLIGWIVMKILVPKYKPITDL